ncbi:MAG: hypothetical protein K9G12_00010 [Candidatus Nanopelagicales bacterium]|nr:hypothetical protein [Candidatus Nanopelagicales bacterium]
MLRVGVVHFVGKLCIILMCVVIPLEAWNIPSTMADPLVIGNPEQVRFEGTGGLILPSSVSTENRDRAARCVDCSWRMTPACIPGPDDYCDAAIRSCPGLIDHVRTWLRIPGGEWVETGLICLTTYRVVTVRDAQAQLAETFERYVPPQQPRCYPSAHAVVNLPLVCDSGQSTGVHVWAHELAGHTIDVLAEPRWMWNFDGNKLSTARAGGNFPDMSVSHTFRSAGSKNMVLETRWTGSFTVDQLGPFPIEASLNQRLEWVVEMGEARARLVQPG